VATTEVGRVRLRSGAVMRGYVGDRASGQFIDGAATAQVLDDQGWITTGDLGWVGADGNLRLVGRVAEMYIRGGYNVYPAEVEAVLGGHPGVGEVAVVGVPDPVLGEIGAAVIVAVPGVPTPDLAELRALSISRLADYKAPDRLVVVDQLPLTAMAKVDKRALSARLAAPGASDATAPASRTTKATPNAKVGS
jgi:acyl-CoA synthetase (AMP-forming)/AMP-acid ligase II